MARLNATMFYKIKFSIEAAASSDDLLWKIVMHLKDWQTRKCRRRNAGLSARVKDWSHLKIGNRLFADDNSLYIMSEFFSPEKSPAEYWACRIIENLPPDPGYANRQWITEIGYEQSGRGAATLSCVVSYSDRAGFIGPYMDVPDPTIPKLISNIVGDSAIHSFCGSDELTNIPQELKVGDWPAFYQKIMDKDRLIPYIFVSPQITNKDTKEIIHLVNPHVLAEKIFGNAAVYYTEDLDFLREMSYMNPDYACFGGGIRVYQPNTAEAARHRYLTANDIQNFGEESVIGFLLRAFTQNVNFYDTFFGLEECKRKKLDDARERRRADLLARHQAQLTQVENESYADALEEADKRLQAETLAANLQEQLEEEKRKNFSLESQVEQLQSAAEENGGLRRALDVRFSVSSLPDTVDDVVEYFTLMFADRLAFSNDALKSIKNCTISPQEIWRVLFSLANVMRDLYKDGKGDIFAAFRAKTGFDIARGEGAMTRKDKTLMRQFQTEYNGEMIDVEAHITYPKLKQSIHVGYSDKAQKVIIGHCGEHLDNYTTRKVK